MTFGAKTSWEVGINGVFEGCSGKEVCEGRSGSLKGSEMFEDEAD